ncbi:MAG TPA: RodZ domain-containing protein [Candidatus Polarisedimenticolia bacterium]|nr:RodZ domain-containing protein [Candidatus Polarisedimenticolia bacterium]
MGAFGDRLRREREMRGITLNEITESTKISRRHLDALEGEHFDQLPGGVFNKGFVRAYARFLGIDEDQAVADYSTASNEQPEPENKFPLEVHEEPDRDLNPRRSSLPLVFAIAALIGVLMGYGFWIKSKPHSPEAVNTRQSAPASAVNAPQANVPAPSAITPSSSEPIKASAQRAHSTPVTKPAPPEAAAVPRSTEPRPAAAPGESADPPPSVKEKAFFVQVKAKEDSWVSIVADGKSVMQRVLSADKQKKIKAGKTLVLRTGNAGGIEVSFNGHPLGALGNENEPRTLTFNASGLVQ